MYTHMVMYVYECMHMDEIPYIFVLYLFHRYWRKIAAAFLAVFIESWDFSVKNDVRSLDFTQI